MLEEQQQVTKYLKILRDVAATCYWSNGILACINCNQEQCPNYKPFNTQAIDWNKIDWHDKCAIIRDLTEEQFFDIIATCNSKSKNEFFSSLAETAFKNKKRHYDEK